jgi:putative flippase GtrA
MIKKLLIKKKSIFSQIIRYFITGFIAAIIDFSTFATFVYVFNVYYPIAIFLSFSFGTITNFFICNFFVFDRTSSLSRTMLKHYISSLGGLTINEITVILLTEFVKFPYLMISKAIGIGLAFIVNFLLIKFYAFKDNKK